MGSGTTFDISNFPSIHIDGRRKDGKEPLDDGNQPTPSENRRMMLSPQYWPIWPVLPLVNRNCPPGSFPRTGVLYDRDGDEGGEGPPRFGFREVGLSDVTDEDLKAFPEADIDQLLADGWVVD